MTATASRTREPAHDRFVRDVVAFGLEVGPVENGDGYITDFARGHLSADPNIVIPAVVPTSVG